MSMKNIVIYSENAASKVESIIKSAKTEYNLQVLDSSEIKSSESLNPDLVILEASDDVVSDILVRTKVPAPLIIITSEIIGGVTVRAEAYDYLLTPINPKELIIRIENMIKIRYLKEQIKVVSTTDELTGLNNRSYVHQRLDAELSRAKRYNMVLSCLLIDIDFFKVVNDIYGYDWGDVLLKDIAEIIKKHARKEDIITRYGDEEFLLVLPNTDEDSAYVFSERLRKDIERMEFIPDGEEERHPITISGGISSYPFLNQNEENANTLIRYAEHALYNAKRRGKNKIVQFSQINLEF